MSRAIVPMLGGRECAGFVAGGLLAIDDCHQATDDVTGPRSVDVHEPHG